MKKKKHKKKQIELNVPYTLIQYSIINPKYIDRIDQVKILLLDGEKRVVFENGRESVSLYEVKGDLVKTPNK